MIDEELNELEEEIPSEDEINRAVKEAVREDCTKQLCNAIRKYPPLTIEQEQELAHRYINGDEEARELFINSNMRLVIYFARKYLRSGLEFSDLILEGSVGLIRAVDKFDPDRNLHFSTSAVEWIKSYIIQFINKNQFSVKLSDKVKKNILKVKAFLNDGMTEEQIADNLKLTVELVRQYAITDITARPIDDFVQNTVEDEEENVSAIIETKLLKKELHNTLRKLLTEKEFAVIIKSFGFDCHEYTDNELAQTMGLTAREIRQIKNSAISKLRKNKFQIKPLLDT